MSAREQILARARAAVAGVEVPDIPRGYELAGAGGASGERLELFVERLRDYGTGVRTGAGMELPELIAAAAGEHGAARLAVPAHLSWTAPGIELVADQPPLSAAALESIGGALTGCALAVAETGTIVLDGEGASGRRMLSLVPDLHVCVVEAGRVVPRVPDAIDRLQREDRHRRPLTFVSGPSATSDIGFQRVEGVHGPRRLEVVILTSPADP